MVDEPSRGKWHEEHPDEKDESGKELETDGNEPCCGTLSVACAADEIGSTVKLLDGCSSEYRDLRKVSIANGLLLVNPETDHDSSADCKLL